MCNNTEKGFSREDCIRFGKIAVDLGFVTAGQLKEDISEQIDDDLAHKPHRLLETVTKKLATN